MDSERSTVSPVAIARLSSSHEILFQVLSDYRPHCTPADMTIGPHILCSNILVLLRTGQSSEDLDSETLTSVKEHIHRLESEIVARDEHLRTQATSLQHERNLAVQDLENHKSIFAPIRRLPNDVLLYIFQTSIDDRVKLDVKTIPWLLGYICHHWRALSRSAGSLWTDIFLESVCSSNLPPGRSSLRKHLLSLSRSSPLKIRIAMIHPRDVDPGDHYFFHREVCPGDDRGIVWEDIILHSHRWSHIALSTQGSVAALRSFSCHLPCLRSLFLSIHGASSTTDICRLFSSVPLLRDLDFCGSIVLWRVLARTVPLHQLVNLTMSLSINEASEENSDLDDANPDFYACLKDAILLENLAFKVYSERIIFQPSGPSDASLFHPFIHHNIHTLALDGDIPTVLGQCFMPNLKELFVYRDYEMELIAPMIAPPAHAGSLLRFACHSKSNLQTFSYFKSLPLPVLNSAWEQWSTSLTKLTITVVETTRADTVRELTFEEGRPGVLPNLQYLKLRAPEGLCIFEDDSLVKMAFSRHTRCPGTFTDFLIHTILDAGEVPSRDSIIHMKRLRDLKTLGVRVQLLLGGRHLDHFETDEVFAEFLDAWKYE